MHLKTLSGTLGNCRWGSDLIEVALEAVSEVEVPPQTIRQPEWQAKRCLTIVFCFSPFLAPWSWGLRLRGLAGFELSISLLRLISLGNPEAPEEPLSVGLCVCVYV